MANYYCCCTSVVRCRYCDKRSNAQAALLPPSEYSRSSLNYIDSIINHHIYELDALETNKMSYSKLFSINEFSSAIRSKQFIVGSVSTEGGLSFSPNPTAHTTRSSARSECARLAKLSPGRLYVFVELAGEELLPASTTVSI